MIVQPAFPHYSVNERRVDAVVHILGVSGSIVGASILLAAVGRAVPADAGIAIMVYSAGLLSMFGFSAAYNLTRRPALKAILRRCDHAAIYFKIAATYTPFAIVILHTGAGDALLATVWSIAAFGVSIKILFPASLVRTSYVLYLLQGWAGLLTLDALVAAMPGRVLLLLTIGGVVYTLGVAIHLWHRLRYHNAVWHALVLTAAAFHYTAVADAVGYL